MVAGKYGARNWSPPEGLLNHLDTSRFHRVARIFHTHNIRHTTMPPRKVPIIIRNPEEGDAEFFLRPAPRVVTTYSIHDQDRHGEPLIHRYVVGPHTKGVDLTFKSGKMVHNTDAASQKRLHRLRKGLPYAFMKEAEYPKPPKPHKPSVQPSRLQQMKLKSPTPTATATATASPATSRSKSTSKSKSKSKSN